MNVSMGEKKSYIPLDLGVLHFIFYTLLIVYNSYKKKIVYNFFFLNFNLNLFLSFYKNVVSSNC